MPILLLNFRRVKLTHELTIKPGTNPKLAKAIYKIMLLVKKLIKLAELTNPATKLHLLDKSRLLETVPLNSLELAITKLITHLLIFRVGLLLTLARFYLRS